MGMRTLALGLLTSVVMCWALCERKYIQTSSKCTDGTRPVYYFRKGYEGGSNRWHVHFQGGGWCSDVQSCFARMQSPYGGTEFDRQNVSNPNSCDDVKGHMFENTKYLTSNAKLNTMMYNWNTVFVAYCDGGSYAGDAVVEHEGRQLHFKGLDIRRSLINTLLDSEGLDKGSEVLISGCSAGALGVYLGLDDMAGIIRKRRQDAHAGLGPVSVLGMADSGFFLDFRRPSGEFAADLPAVRSSRWYFATPGEVEYHEAYRSTFSLMNMAAGVSPACLAYARTVDVPAYFCMFPEFAVPFITTPIFTKQTRFDAWQNANILRSATPSAVNAYGKLLSETMLSTLIHRDSSRIVYNVAEKIAREHGLTQLAPPHAVFIDSCLSHCSNCVMGPTDVGESIWTSSVLRDRAHGAAFNSYEALVEWYGNVLPAQASAREIGHAHHQHKSKQHDLYQRSPTRRIYLQDGVYPCADCCLCAES